MDTLTSILAVVFVIIVVVGGLMALPWAFTLVINSGHSAFYSLDNWMCDRRSGEMQWLENDNFTSGWVKKCIPPTDSSTH